MSTYTTKTHTSLSISERNLALFGCIYVTCSPSPRYPSSSPYLRSFYSLGPHAWMAVQSQDSSEILSSSVTDSQNLEFTIEPHFFSDISKDLSSHSSIFLLKLLANLPDKFQCKTVWSPFSTCPCLAASCKCISVKSMCRMHTCFLCICFSETWLTPPQKLHSSFSEYIVDFAYQRTVWWSVGWFYCEDGFWLCSVHTSLVLILEWLERAICKINRCPYLRHKKSWIFIRKTGCSQIFSRHS